LWHPERFLIKPLQAKVANYSVIRMDRIIHWLFGWFSIKSSMDKVVCVNQFVCIDYEVFVWESFFIDGRGVVWKKLGILLKDPP